MTNHYSRLLRVLACVLAFVATATLHAVEPRNILLTGFEPFGGLKRPNPSWEGIKALDGQEWNGYRLVCKELPVVWGEVLPKLEEWNSEYQPAAILSLGQGSPAGFTIESVALAKRGQIPDNQRQLPAVDRLAGDGPAKFTATAACDAMAKQLEAKGYAVKVSTNAGQYLCEEALYSLEYLKRKNQLSAPVAFCHVPPLGVTVPSKPAGSDEEVGQIVNPEYVQAFVLDALDALVATTKPEPPAPLADEAEIKKFIEGYFSSWSTGQFDKYDACFMPNACIQLLGPEGQLISYPRKSFVEEQRGYVQQAKIKPREVPKTIDIHHEADVVRVLAYWELTNDKRITHGYDHFTLKKVGGQWKIVHLLFYSTD
jgi:pyroglutamyl-peptidase